MSSLLCSECIYSLWNCVIMFHGMKHSFCWIVYLYANKKKMIINLCTDNQVSDIKITRFWFISCRLAFAITVMEKWFSEMYYKQDSLFSIRAKGTVSDNLMWLDDWLAIWLVCFCLHKAIQRNLMIWKFCQSLKTVYLTK